MFAQQIAPMHSLPVRHRIHFPQQSAEDLDQDEVFFYVLEDPRATNTRAAPASMAQYELTGAG
jgi:hypothetical protein